MSEKDRCLRFNHLLTILPLEKIKGIKNGYSMLLLLIMRPYLFLVKCQFPHSIFMYQVTSDEPNNSIINNNDNQTIIY